MADRRGFTLVEMLTVLMIIALISGFTLVMVANARARARDDLRIADLKRIQQSLETYRLEVDKMASNDGRTAYPYPPLFRQDNALAGSGIYPTTSVENKTQDQGAIQPNFKSFLANTPSDPIYKHNYIYFAPACLRPGQGTVNRPAIISPGFDSQFPPKFRQAKQIRDVPNPGFCPKFSGWLPYIVYALLERPIKGENRQAGLVNLIEKSDRAVAFSSSQPIYAANESNEVGGYGQIIANFSYCYPAADNCFNGYTADTAGSLGGQDNGLPTSEGTGSNNGNNNDNDGPTPRSDIDQNNQDRGRDVQDVRPSPVRSDPAGSPTAKPINRNNGYLFEY